MAALADAAWARLIVSLISWIGTPLAGRRILRLALCFVGGAALWISQIIGRLVEVRDGLMQTAKARRKAG